MLVHDSSLQADRTAPLPWTALKTAQAILGWDGDYPACGSGIVCRYPRGMALLAVVGLCLFPTPTSRTKAGEPGSSPGHFHLKPVDVPTDIFEAS